MKSTLGSAIMLAIGSLLMINLIFIVDCTLRYPEVTPPEPETYSYTAPPMHIQQIAGALDDGHDITVEAQLELSRYIEQNPRAWNVWCQIQRRNAKDQHPNK